MEKPRIVCDLAACEEQAKVHYAMPVRNMLYDSLSYVEQMKQLWEIHKKEELTEEEFLSKFRKEDTLVPVITIVFYYGEAKWDGSKELYEMFSKELRKDEKLLKKYIANYKINLVDAGHLEEQESFKTDLQKVLGMLQYRKSKTDLVRYVNENGDYFRNVDESTYHVIREFLHSDKMWKKEIKLKGGEEKVNMCRALEELYNDGISEGERSHLLKLIRVKLDKGKSVEEIADALEESVDVIQELIQEL